MTYKAELEQKYASIRERLYGPKSVPVAMQAASDAIVAITPDKLGYCPPVAKKRPTGVVSELTGLAPLATPRDNYVNVLRMVAAKHNLDPNDIMGENRNRKLIAARHEFWYIAHFELGYSYCHIGRFAKKDHSTILHGAKKHAAMLDRVREEAHPV
jgi:hypothetical protein